jgi:hypothetical protein
MFFEKGFLVMGFTEAFRKKLEKQSAESGSSPFFLERDCL